METNKTKLISLNTNNKINIQMETNNNKLTKKDKKKIKKII